MILASCSVDLDGRLFGSSLGVSQVTRTSTGRYLVDFFFRLPSGAQMLITPHDQDAAVSVTWKERPCDRDELASDRQCEVETFGCRSEEACSAGAKIHLDCGFNLVALLP